MKKIIAKVRENASVLTNEEMKKVQGGDLPPIPGRRECYSGCPPRVPMRVVDCSMSMGTCSDGSPMCVCY